MTSVVWIYIGYELLYYMGMTIAHSGHFTNLEDHKLTYVNKIFMLSGKKRCCLGRTHKSIYTERVLSP